MQSGDSVMKLTAETGGKYGNKAKEVAKKAASKVTQVIGDIISGDAPAPVVQTAGGNGSAEPAIVGKENWGKMGGVPVGKSVCESSLKKFSGGGKFDSCSGNVFKGLEGGRKYKRTKRKTRRKSRKKKRRKSRKKKRRKSRKKKRRRSRKKSRRRRRR
jgi:hypothetical protein